MKLLAIGLIGFFSIFSEAQQPMFPHMERRSMPLHIIGDTQECNEEKVAYFRSQVKLYGLLRIRNQERAHIWKNMAQDHRNIARELVKFPKLVTEYQTEAEKYETKAKEILDGEQKYNDMITHLENRIKGEERKCIEQRNRETTQR